MINELLYADDLVLMSYLVLMISADFKPAKKRSGQTRSKMEDVKPKETTKKISEKRTNFKMKTARWR